MDNANGRTERDQLESEGKGKETESQHWKVKCNGKGALQERHPCVLENCVLRREQMGTWVYRLNARATGAKVPF